MFRLLVLVHFACAVLALDVAIPIAPPSGAPSLSSSLVSLSLEQDLWTDWSGTTSRNQFFFNTLDNLGRITGVPPQIRIGANSEDRTDFNAAIPFSQATFPAPTPDVPFPEASHITVGNGFYLTAKFLPSGTHVIWGVNLGSNNLATAFLQARSIAEAFNSNAVKGAGVVLDFIEIGNQADLYRNNGLRSTSYSSQQYTHEWIHFGTNISATVGISSSSHTKYFGPSFAGSSHSTTGFSPQAVFNEGILASAPGRFLTTISQHHYSANICVGNNALLQQLMSKSSIRGNLVVFIPDVQASRQRGLDYVLGETNSFACHGAAGVSNTAGAALWALDYALFASQVGVSRLFFHNGIGSKYNLIQPVTLTRSILDGSPLSSPLPPHIQPQYYSAIVVAEAIGSGGSTRAVEININDPTIAGYAFYEGGKLVRAVFIDSKAFFKGSSTRGSVHLSFNFSGAGSHPSKITIKRLTIGHADDVSGVTWGGQTYETADGRVAGTLRTTTAPVGNGLDIHDTEAVLVSFS